MNSTHASFSGELAVPPSVWQGATTDLAAGVPQYDAMQTSDPDLDAIFADFLPPALPYNGMFSGAVEQFFAPGQHTSDASAAAGSGGAPSYGGFDTGWGLSFPGRCS